MTARAWASPWSCPHLKGADLPEVLPAVWRGQVPSDWRLASVWPDPVGPLSPRGPQGTGAWLSPADSAPHRGCSQGPFPVQLHENLLRLFSQEPSLRSCISTSSFYIRVLYNTAIRQAENTEFPVLSPVLKCWFCFCFLSLKYKKAYINFKVWVQISLRNCDVGQVIYLL